GVMTIDMGCPTCGRTLRLADEHAGKQIRCPACQQISIAPGKTETAVVPAEAAADSASNNATTWHLRMPDGPIYGPIGWNEVLAWAVEGRIAADCELAEARAGPWRKATELLPRSTGIMPQAMGPTASEAYP